MTDHPRSDFALSASLLEALDSVLSSSMTDTEAREIRQAWIKRGGARLDHGVPVMIERSEEGPIRLRFAMVLTGGVPRGHTPTM